MKLDDVIPLTDNGCGVGGNGFRHKARYLGKDYLHHHGSISVWVDVISEMKSSHHVPTAFGD